MDHAQEQKTLRDYLAVFRRRRGVIVTIALIAAGLAFGLSLTKAEVYEAETSVRFKDPADELPFSGLQASQGDLPAQTAAQGADRATRASVMQGIKRQLGLNASVAELQDRITAKQDPESNLVEISAEAGTPIEAARLANSAATQAAKDVNTATRRQYGEIAEELKRQAQDASLDRDQERRAILVAQAARIETLSTVSRLGEVTDRATSPEEPISPRPTRNAVVAGFFGLILGLIAAGILESLDRRLRDPDEVQDELGVPLAGVVADHALGGVPISGVPGEEHVAAMDMFRMLRTNVAFLNVDHPAKVVLVTSSLPDEGKTTVATGLALASAVTGRRTLLIEVDLHRPVHSERLGTRESPGLTDLLTGEAAPRDVLQAVRFVDPGASSAANGSEDHKVTLSCIAAGTSAGHAAELLGSRRFADLLREVSGHYDLIVLDSAPVLAVAETLEMAPIADTILFCVRLGQTTLDEARRGIHALSRLPERTTGLVLTDLGAAQTGGYDYYSYAYSYRFDHDEQSRRRDRPAVTSQAD